MKEFTFFSVFLLFLFGMKNDGFTDLGSLLRTLIF